MTTKTLEELEEMREERGIYKSTLSECCGANHSSWGRAVRRERVSQSFKNNAIMVFKYYDRNGYVPMQHEIPLEELGKT